MRALLQRVDRARVTVAGEEVGAIGRGLLVFLAACRGDGLRQARRLAARVASYRVFPDAAGRTNLDLRQVGGAALVVSQFTLAADTRKGTRPSFSTALEPEAARELLGVFCGELRGLGVPVAEGRFGAEMVVELVNHGPATYLLEVPPGT